MAFRDSMMYAAQMNNSSSNNSIPLSSPYDQQHQQRPMSSSFPSARMIHHDPQHDNDDDDEEQESGFNTFSDFNNSGSRRFSQNRLSSYGDYSGKSAASILLDNTTSAPKLSTVDWKRGEGAQEADAKLGRRRTIIAEKRRSCWHSLTGEGRWKVLVFVVFGFLIALGITLYFVIPRVPSITFLSNNPLTSNDQKATVTTIPAEFSFLANVSLAIDARASYIPVQFNTLAIQLTEVTTNNEVAVGSLAKGFSVPGRAITPIIIPVLFSGSYSSSASEIYGIMRSACVHIFNGQTRPTLSLILSVEMSIVGIIGTTRTSAQLANVVCPVQFAANAS